jgi:import inner membrane translocase subunit TIM22
LACFKLMLQCEGGVFGFAFGAFFGSTVPIEQIENKKFVEQVVEGFRYTARTGWSMGKNFAVVGLAFAGTECVIESYRAKTDIYNSMAAGCITGGGFGARGNIILVRFSSVEGGVKSALVGCTGFAAFGLVIDHILFIKKLCIVP